VRVPEIAGLVLRDLADGPLLAQTGRGYSSSVPDHRITQMIFRTGAARWPGLAGRGRRVRGIWLAILAVERD
jgi:hypothetical protein